MQVRPLTHDEDLWLQNVRVDALGKMPYMAPILYAFRPVSAPGLGTWAVDKGLRLYIDFEHERPFGLEHAAQSMLHEAMHIVSADYAVPDELGVKPSMATNIVTDAANNDDLFDAGCTIFKDDNEWGYITPKTLGAPRHKTPHEYWKYIPEGAKQGASGDASGDPAGCGSGAGNPWEGELPSDNSLGGSAPAATATEVDRVRTAVATDAVEHSAKGRGHVPGHLMTRFERMLAPQPVRWQNVLRRIIPMLSKRGGGGSRETYKRRDARRHRQSVGGGKRVVYPTYEVPQHRLVTIRDTSGSMNVDDLAEETAQIEQIARRMGVQGDNLRIVDFDSNSARAFKFGQGDLYAAGGRGGTDMARAVKEAAALDPKPTCIVVFTDGMTGWPSDPVGVPVVVGVIGRQDAAERHAAGVPNWMHTVVIGRDA